MNHFRLDRPLSIFLFLIIVGLAQPMAAEVQLELGEPKRVDGWQPIASGVWQRTTVEGLTDTWARGPDGLRFAVEGLRAQLTTLADAFLRNPTDETLQALEDHTRFIEQIEDALRHPPAQAKAAAPACQRTFAYGATAGHSLLCGGLAFANASYSTNCSETCTTYTYTYWSVTCGSTTDTGSSSCSQTGTNVSCNSSVSSPREYDNGTMLGYAYIYCPALGNLFLSEYASYNFANSYGYCDC